MLPSGGAQANEGLKERLAAAVRKAEAETKRRERGEREAKDLAPAPLKQWPVGFTVGLDGLVGRSIGLQAKFKPCVFVNVISPKRLSAMDCKPFLIYCVF